MTAQSRTTGTIDAHSDTTGSSWSWAYRAGGAAALLSAVFFPIQIAVFILNPPPGTVEGWFALLQNNPLIGLLNLDLLLIIDEGLAILIFLALYIALRRYHESFMAVGTALTLASTVLFIAANPAFAMLSLSGQSAAAGAGAQAAFLSAGQAVLSMWQGSAFQAGYLLGSIGPIIVSAVMLRDNRFGKAAAITGILANVIALGLYVPKIGTYISVFSVVFLWIWYILVSRRLFQLSQ